MQDFLLNSLHFKSVYRRFHDKTQFLFMLLIFSALLLSGDIETNPGPKHSKILSICHWNLNSVWVDDFAKISQISTFLNIHNFDIFCVGESFLPSDIEDDDPSISIDNFELTRCKYAFIIKITYH